MPQKSSKLSYYGSPHNHLHKEEGNMVVDKVYDHHNQDKQVQEQELIPGLPDHIAHLILCKIPPTKVYSVCHLWRSLIYTPLFPPYYCLYTLLTPNNDWDLQQQFLTNVSLFSFDPITTQWELLPPPPNLSLLLRHPPFISRDLPVQSVTVGDRLAVVAGTTQDLTPALSCPVLFDPITRDWGYGSPVLVPRRWCASGALNGSLYIVSGVGSQFSTDTARSVERWNPNLLGGVNQRKWERLRPLKDGRFSREAADAIGWRSSLCMVNVKGNAAKQGGIYHSKDDTWGEMKEGMLRGWRGPAASMEEEIIYVVDESKGVVRRYDEEGDVWVDVVESERLRGAKQVAARGGRLCVVCSGGSDIVVVDVVGKTPKMWVVEPPHGFNVAAVHVLPRLTRPHFNFNHKSF